MYAVNRKDNHGFLGGEISYVQPPETTIEEGTVTPKEREELLQAIEYMRGLKNDWNGFGATAPSHASLHTTENFIKELPFGFAYPDKISPDMEETVALAWTLESGEVLHMMIDGLYIYLSRLNKDNSVDYLIEEGELKFISGGFFPDKIKVHLPSSPYRAKKNGNKRNNR
ncbi:MAG: hypothetical protein ACRBDI_03425 [Alphaproteobacteria bacterium]